MITLSDEILNKYIDGELSRDDIKEIEAAIHNSREARIRLNALREADRSLRNLTVPEIRSNFTSIVMGKIQRSIRSKQDQKKFIIGIISVFIIMCLAIVSIIGSEMIRTFNPEAPTALKNSIKYVTSASEFIATILSSKNLTIVGGAFSFFLIISAWLLFDYSKILRKAGK